MTDPSDGAAPTIMEPVTSRRDIVPAAVTAVAAAGAAGSAQAQTPSNPRFANPPGMSSPTTYSQVVEVNGPNRTVYIAGQTGVDASGKIAQGFRAQVMENLKTALASVGGVTSSTWSSSIAISRTSRPMPTNTARYAHSISPTSRRCRLRLWCRWCGSRTRVICSKWRRSRSSRRRRRPKSARGRRARLLELRQAEDRKATRLERGRVNGACHARESVPDALMLRILRSRQLHHPFPTKEFEKKNSEKRILYKEKANRQKELAPRHPNDQGRAGSSEQSGFWGLVLNGCRSLSL